MTLSFVLSSEISAALPAAFPRLAFVDLETTGATASADRITEIGIVEVDENGVREWSSLVNPQSRIPEFIESLTGITNDMVSDAPLFSELADEVQARLEGRLFIAHNARFDHSFLKNEFRRLDMPFRPTVLCTVKLSRRLYPGFARHNLDSLIERHGLSVSARHRALGDARLIWQFWQTLHATLPPDAVATALKALTARPSLPSQLDAALIDELPTTPGVYLFYGENDVLLYVGKANDIRRRVLSHFSGDHSSARELELSQQIRRMDWIETAGEIGALLQEAALVKERLPTLNHQLRRNDTLCAWRVAERVVTPGRGPQLALSGSDDLFFGHDDHLFGPFQSARAALATLRARADEYQLCPVLLGLDKGKFGKPCFACQVKRCLGACAGHESLDTHRARLLEALQPLRIERWPWSGPIGIREGAPGKEVLHIIDGWAYLGTAADEQDAWSLVESRKPRFDPDVYRILRKRLPKLKRHVVRIG